MRGPDKGGLTVFISSYLQLIATVYSIGITLLERSSVYCD